MRKPEVSIVIYYNRDRGWLKDAIHSVEVQDYSGEIQLIKSFNPKGTCAENLNAGIEAATGKYIKFFAEDDMLTPNCLKDSLKVLKSGYDFIHGKAYNKFGTKISPQAPYPVNPTLADMIEKNRIHGLTLMYRAELLKENPIDETLDCAEEYDLNLKLLSKGYRLGYVNQFLGIYRRHDLQKSLGKGIDQVARAKKIQKIIDRYK